MSIPRLLVYEATAGGHRAEHLAWLADGWMRRRTEGVLRILAPHALVDAHPELPERARASGGSVEVAAFPPPPVRGTQWDSLFGTERARPLAETLAEHRPAAALLMSFDHFLAPLALGRSMGPVPISALTLRPTLHYAELGSAPDGLRERAERALKRTWMRRALRHPALDTLFTLDPTSVDALASLGGAHIVGVPDPVPDEPVRRSPEAVRASLGIETERRLFVLAGGLDVRKGPLATLNALLRVSPEAARRAAVVFWGRVPEALAPDMQALVEQVQRRTEVRLIVRDEYVPMGEMQTLVAAADVLLTPYLRHVGSSGFLMRAAGAGVPVLSQAWGAMGHLVREHALGQTVDPADPDALAAAFARAVEAPSTGFDSDRAAAFARGYTVDGFADAFLDRLAP